MSLHDDYARVTPFEIAFPDGDAAERLLRAVSEEAASRGVDAELPGVFVTLGAVGDFLRDLQAPDASDEATREMEELLFHAVHFVRSGRPLHLLETGATRYLVEGAPSGAPRPPTPAGYLQLPQHLFWMGGGEGRAPESVDGLFWVASEAGALHVLLITGLHAEQMAFRALPLPEVPLDDARHWLEEQVREGAPDYSSQLPGQELDGLYSVETAGEILKLVARFFAYLEAVPHAAEPAEVTDEAPGGARPSRLPYTRVKLVP